ncbi:hypothetical protein [Fibrella aquatilis]|uniref:Uncharacterized protein n=1 Tax=Fibrella aquatilis TaxID=2817059 RepID=A0A939G6T2_9BACT|nr:hypothetical protein [Fibrella aquatilis]MBO0932090.1 hypothetical protein [Fibrella aquatilis]
MKNALLLLITIWLLAPLEACRDGIYACMAPPPMLTFQPVRKDGTNLITSANASTVIVRFYNRNDPRTLTDARAYPNAFTSYNIVSNANAIGDTTRFFLSVDDKPLGYIQLKTQKGTEPCNPWEYASEVRFNGNVVSLNTTTYTYQLIMP